MVKMAGKEYKIYVFEKDGAIEFLQKASYLVDNFGTQGREKNKNEAINQLVKQIGQLRNAHFKQLAKLEKDKNQ